MKLKEKILDDFEHGDIEKYEINHSFVTSYDISLSNDQAKYGETSLKLSYHFGGWLSGNGAMYITFKDDLRTDVMPCKFGVWVYGDGKSPWLRAVFEDGGGGEKIVNLTSDNINWHGWKHLEVAIDSNWKLPLKLKKIYAVETNKTHQSNPNYCGDIYMDRLRFIYVDHEDLVGPMFSNTFPDQSTVYKDTFMFSTIVTDKMSGVDPKSIKVKINNEKVRYQFCEKEGKISYQFSDREPGTYHILVEAKDYAGNVSIPNIDREITIDLQPDIDKPVISNITPTETSIVRTNTPRITFKLVDEKSGVNESDIIIILNGHKLAVTYDESTGWGYAVSFKELMDGEHNFTITAKDRAGNQLGPIMKKFTIKGLGQPKNWNNFNVSVIPDTHSYKYGQTSFQSVKNDDTDFVIQMGDLVDQATAEEYVCLQENLNILADTPILTVPGNHEAFQNNLDLYMDIFGSPTYHLTYGNALFIFLNSAYDQSFSISDSTQFDYLEKVLDNHSKKNVIIVTHVPTKDIFGTAHEMNRNDAKKLEQILSAYKSKNEDIHITVLFGHLHVLQQWEIDDVCYIITGNAASKGYVANKHGNILGHGMLTISESGISYNYLPNLTVISIVHDNDQIILQKGSYHRLHVDGEVSKLNSRYKVRLTNFDLIGKVWLSDHEEIASVNKHGVVQAVGIGTTTIAVEISGQKTATQITVINHTADHQKEI